MKLESLKSWLNNQKKKQIIGKSTKFATVFIKNKANFVNSEICVTPFQTSKYEILSAWRDQNQTQFKPNTNPIYGMAKFALSSFMTNKYVKFENLAGEQTNPIQTQANPKQSQFHRRLQYLPL